MQTLSRIVPAQGEKLKHKSGGGKLRGGRLFKGGGWAGGAGCRLPRSRPSRASISSGFPRRRGGKKRVCVEGQVAGFPVGSAALQRRNRPPRWQASGGGGWFPSWGGPSPGLVLRPLRAERCSCLALAVGTRAAGVLGEGNPSPRPFPAPGPRLGRGGWAAPDLEALQAHAGKGGSALGRGDFSSYLSFIARDRVGAGGKRVRKSSRPSRWGLLLKTTTTKWLCGFLIKTPSSSAPSPPPAPSTEKSWLKCCLQIGRDTRLPYSHPRP